MELLFYISYAALVLMLFYSELRIRRLEKVIADKDALLEKNRAEVMELIKDYRDMNKEQGKSFKSMFDTLMEFMKSTQQMHSDTQVIMLDQMEAHKETYKESTRNMSEVVDNLSKIVTTSSEQYMQLSAMQQQLIAEKEKQKKE